MKKMRKCEEKAEVKSNFEVLTEVSDNSHFCFRALLVLTNTW